MTSNALQSISPNAKLSLFPLREQGSRPPIFLVPGAAFVPYTFSNLSKCLSADQPVYSFHAIGEAGQSIRWRSVEDAAQTCLDLIRSIQPHGPYRLGGYSMGAFVAYEIARSLQAQHEPIELLINFDMAAPAKALRWKCRLVQVLSFILRWPQSRRLEWNYRMHGALNHYFWLSPHRKKPWLIKSVRAFLLGALPKAIRLPPAPDGVDPNFILHNIQLSRSYVPRRYDGSLLIYKSTRGLPRNPVVRDLAMRWGRLVSGQVDRLVVEAEHGTIMSRPQIESVAADLDPRLVLLQRAR